MDSLLWILLYGIIAQALAVAVMGAVVLIGWCYERRSYKALSLASHIKLNEGKRASRLAHGRRLY